MLECAYAYWCRSKLDSVRLYSLKPPPQWKNLMRLAKGKPSWAPSRCHLPRTMHALSLSTSFRSAISSSSFHRLALVVVVLSPRPRHRRSIASLSSPSSHRLALVVVVPSPRSRRRRTIASLSSPSFHRYPLASALIEHTNTRYTLLLHFRSASFVNLSPYSTFHIGLGISPNTPIS
jgi:hypothetical protein